MVVQVGHLLFDHVYDCNRLEIFIDLTRNRRPNCWSLFEVWSDGDVPE
ncbi:hypothetical protein KSF_108850 [Reticulibacter mediterranei]|uniref:Uncharacterized protein n=1 Tax=Reticulibacter mediterranei TaxID=2778369 RepID=A0A8J3N6X3_9CHLR|nr:hypothetical protein KSF_108850 [Reticulibacter mediterranei]